MQNTRYFNVIQIEFYHKKLFYWILLSQTNQTFQKQNEYLIFC